MENVKYFMTFNKETGDITAHYNTDIYSEELILSKVEPDEHLKEIDHLLWEHLIGNADDGIDIAKVSSHSIETLLAEPLGISRSSIIEYIQSNFEEHSLGLKYEPTEQEKDIMLLAGCLKDLISIVGNISPNEPINTLDEIVSPIIEKYK